MRVAPGITAVSIVLVSLPAPGQQWSDYINPEYRFRVNFPAEPTEQDAVYMSAEGSSHTARAFSSEQDTGRFRVLVVQFPSDIADMAGEFDHAAEPYRQLGEVVYDQAGEYEDIAAYEINVIGPDGRQIYVSFAYHDRSLFIAEGSVDADAFPPIQFQQSLWITDEAGAPINGGRRLGN
ncbi:MAG: hypothetical protein OXQ29_09170 [Rhodospirillaceae bacterium]|nr:hypothetical protein [Rhodospirillaceae bacterium]